MMRYTDETEDDKISLRREHLEIRQLVRCISFSETPKVRGQCVRTGAANKVVIVAIEMAIMTIRRH